MRIVKYFVMVSILFLCTALVVLGHATVYARDKLQPGEELRRGDNLTSANGRYSLTLQRDGNLVLYGPRKQALWSSDTQGIPIEKCIMQTDGNLVLYLPDGQPVWSSNTQGYPPPFLVLQNDGNLVIYQPVWFSGTEHYRREGYHDRRWPR
jgi:hypothetical protein